MLNFDWMLSKNVENVKSTPNHTYKRYNHVETPNCLFGFATTQKVERSKYNTIDGIPLTTIFISVLISDNKWNSLISLRKKKQRWYTSKTQIAHESRSQPKKQNSINIQSHIKLAVAKIYIRIEFLIEISFLYFCLSFSLSLFFCFPIVCFVSIACFVLNQDSWSHGANAKKIEVIRCRFRN